MLAGGDPGLAGWGGRIRTSAFRMQCAGFGEDNRLCVKSGRRLGMRLVNSFSRN
jgi:hypothetical protein